MNSLEEARATFERAVDFLRAGDAPMTERISRAALEDYPNETNFLALLGAALTRQGRAAEARGFLEQAVRVEPEYAKGYEQLGEAQLALGDNEGAVASLRRALDLNPAFEAVNLKLTQLLLSMGRESEAAELFEAFVRQEPHRARLAEAAELQRGGDFAAAEKIYREILRADPGNVTAIRLLATVAMKLEQFRDAAVLLQRALEIAPDFAAARMDLGYAQIELGRFEEAAQTMQAAIRQNPGSYPARVGYANALARWNKTAEAVEAFEEAIDCGPGIAAAYLGLGNALRTLGDHDRCVATYRKGIEVAPGAAEIYWSLSNLKTFRFSAAEVRAMEELVAQDNLPDAEVVHLSFALGKAAEDAGDYEEAFLHYERGNRTRRAQEYYDPVNTEVINERLRKVFTADFIAAKQGLGYMEVQPIFIVGLPRSGSTLLEQILSSHAAVEATHELPEGGRLARYIDRRSLGRDRYPEALTSAEDELFDELGRWYDVETQRHRTGVPYFIDKMPNNFANIGLLAVSLPNAVFVDARRNPLDTCVSCYKQLFARGQSFTYDLEELALYYIEYRRMMDHWHEVLPGRVLEVRYEDVVADLEPQVRRLLKHCGLEWDDACLDFHNTKRAVRTASSEQVRQPIYSDSVGVAERYGAAFDTLREALRPVLD